MIKIVIIRESSRVCYVETYTKLGIKPNPIQYVEACVMGLKGLICDVAKANGYNEADIIESVIKALQNDTLDRVDSVTPSNN